MSIFTRCNDNLHFTGLMFKPLIKRQDL